MNEEVEYRIRKIATYNDKKIKTIVTDEAINFDMVNTPKVSHIHTHMMNGKPMTVITLEEDFEYEEGLLSRKKIG